MQISSHKVSGLREKRSACEIASKNKKSMRHQGRIIFQLLVIGIFFFLSYQAVILLRHATSRSLETKDHLIDESPQPAFLQKNVVFNLDEVKVFGKFVTQKAKLAIGLLCIGDEDDVADTIEYIYSLTNSLSEDEKKDTVIILGTLPSTRAGVEFVRDQLRGSYKLRYLDVHLLQLPDGSADGRLQRADSLISKYNEQRVLLRNKTSIGQLLALLLWYAKISSRYFVLTDVLERPSEGAFRSILKVIDDVPAERFLPQKLANSGTFGLLLPEKCLDAMWTTAYWFAPYKEFSTILSYVSWLRKDCTLNDGQKIFQKVLPPKTSQQRTKNPPALVASTMTVYDQNFASNPYEFGTLFWSDNAPINSTITINFFTPVRLTRVIVETGYDVFLTDSFSGAVLEASYARFALDRNKLLQVPCGHFQTIGNFSEMRVDLKASKALEHPISCLRIRMTEDPGHWIAIRRFLVESEP